jgi:uncharacterized protein (TIGR02301 family)
MMGRLLGGPLRDYGAANPMQRMTTIALLTLCLAAGDWALGPAHAQWGGFGGGGWGGFGGYQRPPWQRPAPRREQPREPQQPDAGHDTSPEAAPRAAPFDHDLQRLSEILGALHFLRGICGTNEGPKWRNEAQALIDAEASGDRHDQMVASFNRGYQSFQQSYRACTPAADIAIRRYLDEGAKISRDITARYAN